MVKQMDLCQWRFVAQRLQISSLGYQLLGNSELRSLQMMLVLKWTDAVDTLLTAVHNYPHFLLSQHQELAVAQLRGGLDGLEHPWSKIGCPAIRPDPKIFF